MQVTLLRSFEEFDELKVNWEDVYNADLKATIFVSWAWTKAWIKLFPRDWLVIGVRQNEQGPYVAFMALRRKKDIFTLVSGGVPLVDHTGFVCRKEYEKKAISTIAEFIQNSLKWNTLSLEAVFDTRLDLFIQSFSTKKYSVSHQPDTQAPFISLPENWEDYLSNYLKKKTRGAIRRSLREVDRLSGFSVIETTQANLEEQIETLLKFRVKQWGKLPMRAERYRSLFRITFAEGCLRLIVLKDNEVVIGAFAGFVDPIKKALYGYNITYNLDYHGIHSPGLIVNILNIQYALEQGFEIFDLGVGDERYKFSLGAKPRFNQNVTIERKGIVRIRPLIRNAWRIGRRAVRNPRPKIKESKQSIDKFNFNRIQIYEHDVVKSYKHDSKAWTQGIVFDEGVLYESTGQKWFSSIRKVCLETGNVIAMKELPAHLWGEGITIYHDKVFQLTHMTEMGFIYDKQNLNIIGEFKYEGEGWGLTNDGEHLIMSNGSSILRCFSPETFKEFTQIQVHCNDKPQNGLNELQFINGLIYANIHPTDYIAIINPQTGQVVGWINLEGLLSIKDQEGKTDNLNGIAYNNSSNQFFVTGKLWPKLFEIKLRDLPELNQ